MLRTRLAARSPSENRRNQWGGNAAYVFLDAGLQRFPWFAQVSATLFPHVVQNCSSGDDNVCAGLKLAQSLDELEFECVSRYCLTIAPTAPFMALIVRITHLLAVRCPVGSKGRPATRADDETPQWKIESDVLSKGCRHTLVQTVLNFRVNRRPISTPYTPGRTSCGCGRARHSRPSPSSSRRRYEARAPTPCRQRASEV